jgi:hypothetical protein
MDKSTHEESFKIASGSESFSRARERNVAMPPAHLVDEFRFRVALGLKVSCARIVRYEGNEALPRIMCDDAPVV